MAIRVCVAGGTGWAGSLVTRAVLEAEAFELVGVIARREAGRDVGAVLGLPDTGILVTKSLEEVLPIRPDVLIDYTKPDSVKERILAALANGVRVVVGTSGLTAEDYEEIRLAAEASELAVIAAGNFSLTAALLKHFAQIAARYLPSWEIIDYAHADKMDAPSGTTRELAEALAQVARNQLAVPIEQTYGARAARGASIEGTQVHSIRLPGYVIAFEAIFGLPEERLTIRHDAGSGAEPYVAGTLLAAQKVMSATGLVRGLDKLLFDS
ncbi:MAG TPA: 4-hydroxy-tetrahydrodipicolinate reductase [Chloroflexia bacterium]